VRRALALFAIVAACQAEPAPRDQWLVTFATDAPLPQFGDRLLVEVLRDGELACPGCRRIFGLDMDAAPASFGIAAPDGSVDEYRLRLRLYRTDHTGADGSPFGQAHIDLLARLPSAEGSTPVTAIARMACFGIPAWPERDETCDPDSGATVAAPLLTDATPLPQSGSWAPAGPVPCPAEVSADMVCIEGGAFLLGSPNHFQLTAELASEPEHLTVLSPFALERDELTVGVVRQLVIDGALPGAPFTPNPDPKAPDATCSYLGTLDASHDDWPVNCLTRDLAESICAARGRRLATEAEWEFAAGQRDAESPYPWGYDDDVCAKAVVAVGRFAEAYVEEPLTCRRLPDGSLGPWGLVPGGSDQDLSAQGLRNLGGNLAEWVGDDFAPYTAACFAPAAGSNLLVDPRCESPGSTWSYRGGGWLGLPGDALVFIRKRASAASTNIGLRCALSW
jgi:formylglycine-generating enzyme required for sulfatase activity